MHFFYFYFIFSYNVVFLIVFLYFCALNMKYSVETTMIKKKNTLLLSALLLFSGGVKALDNAGAIANYKEALCLDREDMSVTMPVTEVYAATGTVSYCYILSEYKNGAWGLPIDTMKIDQKEIDFVFSPSAYPQISLPDTLRIQRLVKQGGEAWTLSAGECIFPVSLNEYVDSVITYCANELPVQIKYTYNVNRYSQPDTYSFQYDGDEVTFYDETELGCEKNVRFVCRTTKEPLVAIDAIETVCQSDTILPVGFTVLRGEVTTYRIGYNAAALLVGFKNDTADLEFADHINVKVPAAAPLNEDYEMYISLYNKNDKLSCGTKTDTMRFSMHLGGFVYSKWDDEYSDVLFVDNKNNIARPSSGTETWHFVEYQWYKNGYPIDGATGQVYYEEFGLNGVYYVMLTDNNGNTYRSCSKEVRPSAKQSGGVWKVKLLGQSHESGIELVSTHSGSWQLLNITGSEVSRGELLSGEQRIEAPVQNGVYMLSLTDEKGAQKVLKLMIK